MFRDLKDLPLVAIMDSGAVHPSNLIECEISEDRVTPWNLTTPIELAVSKQCSPSGLVWLQIRLLGQLFSHHLAVIPDLSCSILLGTDFMILANVPMHPATRRVLLLQNSVSALHLTDC